MQKDNFYNSFTTDDGNQVWAGALTLAWKEFCQLAKQASLIVEGGCPKTTHNFNNCKFNREDLDPSSFYIKSGFGPGTVAQINKQRNEKFPQCTLPPVKAEIGENGAISYAYLFKQVMYPVKFEKREGYLTFKGKDGVQKKVASFFSDDKNQEKQVLICNYVSNQEFILKIEGQQGKDQIYLYKKSEQQPVGEVIEKIIKASSLEDLQCIEQANLFEVPIIDLDYTRQVKQLIGARITNFNNRVIEGMTESIKLRLDQNGARVQNDGVMYTNECAIMNPQIFKLDKPFWIVMKQKGKHPYVCVRINNI